LVGIYVSLPYPGKHQPAPLFLQATRFDLGALLFRQEAWVHSLVHHHRQLARPLLGVGKFPRTWPRPSDGHPHGVAVYTLLEDVAAGPAFGAAHARAIRVLTPVQGISGLALYVGNPLYPPLSERDFFRTHSVGHPCRRRVGTGGPYCATLRNELASQI